MTTLVWLAASSLVWGGVLWGAAIALQSGNDLSGRARQWIWRGAAVLLVMPWLAVPFVRSLAPELSGSVSPSTEFSLAPVIADAPMTVTALNMAASDIVERVEPAFVMPWIEIIVAIVAGGWLLRMVMAGRAARHLGRIISESRPGEGTSLAAVTRWSRTLGLRRAPELRIVPATTTPFSTGVAKPLVCLPEGIEQNMRAETIDLVVGHECIHVARGDGWRRPLERSIADVMWFNPFAWAIRRELDLARELACDEAVVAASSQRKAYARTLRVVAGMSAALPTSAPAASMSLTGGGRLLAMRMKRTLDAAARKPAKAAIVGAIMLAFAAMPMAIAQAILIEAVQPPDMPAPPAPPAPPPGALAIAPQLPTPPAVPTAPEHVQVSPDGVVRVNFSATVAQTGGNAEQGYRVVLLQSDRNGSGEACSASVTGLKSLSVLKDQPLAKGAVIGQRGKSGEFSIGVTCSDELDGRGWPKAAAAPLAPPAPLSPVSAVAPLASPAPLSPVSAAAPPAPLAPPSPVSAVSPIAPVAPVPSVNAIPAPRPAPVAPPAPSSQPAPFATPTAGAVPTAPVTPSSRAIAPTTPAAPAGPTLTPIQFTSGASATLPAKPKEVKTELVDTGGQRVDSLPLRYNVDGAWVIDNQNILYRDTSRTHYLVTLKEACKQLNIRRRSFNFFPSWSLQLLASNTYEVRHDSGLGSGGATGQPCGVARIAQIDDARANTLREAAQRRAW